MRVVAGSAGGRVLRAPAGRGTRPTSDRVREAMFSTLTSMGALDGATVADLFAGSGALGIEALSRGAASAVFVDSAAAAVAATRGNLATVGLSGRAEVVRGDAVRWAAERGRSGEPLDLVLADPPYAWAAWWELLDALAPVARLVVAETGGDWPGVDGWEAARARRYGSSVVTVLRPRARG